MADGEDAAAVLDSVLEALANPHRREIVYVLGLQPCAISQLARMSACRCPRSTSTSRSWRTRAWSAAGRPAGRPT